MVTHKASALEQVQTSVGEAFRQDSSSLHQSRRRHLSRSGTLHQADRSFSAPSPGQLSRQ